jgi:hypothetical protein
MQPHTSPDRPSATATVGAELLFKQLLCLFFLLFGAPSHGRPMAVVRQGYKMKRRTQGITQFMFRKACRSQSSRFDV